MAGEEPNRVRWIRQQLCYGCGTNDGIQAHHAGPKGMGQRAHDDTCVPLCWRCHVAWHDASGVFKTMKKAERRAWAEEAIATYRALWDLEAGE